jgi:hypothetical protein
VLLDLGARSNQQLLETRNGKQLETAAGNQNWSGRNQSDRPSGTYPLTGRGNRSGWFGKPVKLILSRKSPKDLQDQTCPKHFKNHSTFEQEKS